MLEAVAETCSKTHSDEDKGECCLKKCKHYYILSASLVLTTMRN